MVSGFCTGIVALLVDFGAASGSGAKLKAEFGFSDGKFSLLPISGACAVGFSASTFSVDGFTELVNENTGLSTLAGSTFVIKGGFSMRGFVGAGLKVNEVCD